MPHRSFVAEVVRVKSTNDRRDKPSKGAERLAMLECPDCGGEQPHRLRYEKDAVAEMICTQCDRAIVLSAGDSREQRAPDVAAKENQVDGTTPWKIARTLGATAVGLSARAATKPWRLWRQVRQEGPKTLKKMPQRAATKPLRLARELKHKVRELL